MELLYPALVVLELTLVGMVVICFVMIWFNMFAVSYDNRQYPFFYHLVNDKFLSEWGKTRRKRLFFWFIALLIVAWPAMAVSKARLELTPVAAIGEND